MSISPQTLKKCLNNTFVETGTFYGEGVFLALYTGFKNVHSIEISDKFYAYNVERFQGFRNQVHLYHGDSLSIFPKITMELQEPATFWLDSHYDLLSDTKGEKACPILEELQCVLNSPFPHTILVDDMRLFEQRYAMWGGISKQDIVETIRNSGRKQTISYDLGIIENDIMVVKL